ncbi:MAG: RNA polymerase sigma-70 factor [Tannerellaceae bacterium]|jgi:RNA polymerase sigma-70 factor (ECF subfamily)|nr:RNA polymerase sigma-70 factor [Tannerellaceae bacterium]
MEKQGIDKEFEDVYIRYYARMKRFAREYVLSEEDAENILQDVFMDFWEKREAMLIHVNLTAYLFTAVKNRCIDLLRRETLEGEAISRMQEEIYLALRMNMDSLKALDVHLLNEESIESRITQAIAALPDKCRDIFIKSKIEGMRQKEIAAELNITVNTVESQMGIAYKKLRKELKDIYPLFLFLHVI